MDKAALHQDPSPLSPTFSEHETGPARLSAFVSEARSPFIKSAKLIEGLRHRIHAIERHGPQLKQIDPSHRPWTTGVTDIDFYLGAKGLNPAAVHEIKPAAPGAGCALASLAFALRLAARRLEQMMSVSENLSRPRILWCVTRNNAQETGELYGPGLTALGLDPSAFVIVETGRASEALWVMEEALKSGAIGLVIGQFTSKAPSIGLTPARRLSLAAEDTSTPCLVLTPHRSPPTAATATRWGLQPAPSAINALDPRAPGPSRLTATLERCQHILGGEPLSFMLEWPHAAGSKTYRFPMVSSLADRTARPSQPKRRTA